jgi:ABC-type antimicrobial peptide transport system permease subunit
MNLSEQDLKALMNSLMNSSNTTYEDNLKALGYASRDQLSTITVYPKDFSRKKKFEKVLASYNKEMKAQKLKKRVITYNDTMGLMLKNFTSMVNTISYVLVALVSISLVVSSIMIGVITYISVLERRKEIGILRAIGASKRNVAQVFNAETIITGALSGIIGIAIATALMPVMTKIVQTVSKRPDIVTTLPIPYAFGLIVISIVLTLIGGIIPSRRASRSDPVSALRSSD